MRIISGTYGGRRLSPPKNITARPTTDFAKESLFNLLNNRMDFEGIDVLDLFAGTGGIGIECISRGAREVTAVEIAHVQQNWIISCCKQLGIKNLSVIRGDVFKFLSACKQRYDLIFADPPYALGEEKGYAQVLATLAERGVIRPGGLFIAEMTAVQKAEETPGWVLVRDRTYGKTRICMWRRSVAS